MPKPEHSSEAHQERARDAEEARAKRTAEIAEKKARLVKLLDEGLTENVIAQRLSVSARQVRKWKRELRGGGSNGSGKPA
jgi:transposase